jgi:hypothetical protein
MSDFRRDELILKNCASFPISASQQEPCAQDLVRSEIDYVGHSMIANITGVKMVLGSEACQ